MNKGHEALKRLLAAGYSRYLDVMVLTEHGVTFEMSAEGRQRLATDTRFACGVLHGLHRDVGADLKDYRSYNGELGKGSLQIVVDEVTGKGYADIDDHNPYQDVARFLGHAFGEVVPHFFQKLFRREGTDDTHGTREHDRARRAGPLDRLDRG